jgi:hypothetical protein
MNPSLELQNILKFSFNSLSSSVYAESHSAYSESKQSHYAQNLVYAEFHSE